MQDMNWRDHLTVDPAVCHGKACVKGTRVMASVLIDNVAAGVPIDEVVASYPSVTADDVHAALAYAADLARDRTVPLPVEAS